MKQYFKDSDEIKGLAVGNSMRPLLRDKKDIVTVRKIEGKLKVNDVLLYRKADSEDLILHRILKITNDGLIIRGDNVYYKETDVTPDRIVGVMSGFERNGKYYDCKKSKIYKLYVVYVRLSYPIRRVIRKFTSFIRVIKKKTARK